jgi:hypothetical protein
MKFILKILFMLALIALYSSCLGESEKPSKPLTEVTQPSIILPTTSTATTNTISTTSPTTTTITTTSTTVCKPNWKCTEWSECKPSEPENSQGIQTRICKDNNNCQIETGKPIESQACCLPYWTCTDWSKCEPSATEISQGTQTRICGDNNNCRIETGKPTVSQSCNYNSPSPKYAESDVLSVIEEGRNIAMEEQAFLGFLSSYLTTRDGLSISITTPFGYASLIVKDNHENNLIYDLNDVRDVLYWNTLGAMIFNFKTTNTYSDTSDTGDLKAYIEYNGGTVCESKSFDQVSSELDIETTLYRTTISATFDCYNDVYNKKVRFVFIAGDDEASFDIDMDNLK